MAIETMDKATAKMIGERVEAELQKLASELGVQIKRRGGTFDPEGVLTMKLEVALVKGGAVVTKEAAAFKAQAHWYAMNPDDLGCPITVRGVEYTISGLLPRRSKPILVTRTLDGKQFTMAAEPVVTALKGAAV